MSRSAEAAAGGAPVDGPGAGPEVVVETRLEKAFGHGFRRVTAAAFAPYQTAVIRIGFALTWLCFLLREWPHREELYGPRGPFDAELAHQLLATNHSFSVLMWSDGEVWFNLVYGFAVIAAALLLVGWRTRTMSVLFMVGVLSLLNRSILLGDGGDNVLHIMSLYLVMTRCGQVWSLDARRARRAGSAPAGRDGVGVALWALSGLVLLVSQIGGAYGLYWFHDGPLPLVGWSLAFWGMWAAHGLWWVARRRSGELRPLLEVLTRLIHNGALLVIMVEVCLIYATAGWYKIQGGRWQDGTAVYYPMNLHYFAPWPELSHLLASHGTMMMLIAYGTVAVQVAFPFTVFNRRLKNVLLVGMICEHLSIAVLLGLPFFSLAMITADAVFLPTSFLRALGRRVAALGKRYGSGGARRGGGRKGNGPGRTGGADAAGSAPAGAPGLPAPAEDTAATGRLG